MPDHPTADDALYRVIPPAILSIVQGQVTPYITAPQN